MNGEFVDATEIAFLLMRAEIQDGLRDFGREEQLWQLKMRFAQELVDGADGEEEREVRLSTLLTMVEERGGKLSGKKEKLFSSSEPSPAKEVPKPGVSQALNGLEVATAKAKPTEPDSLERTSWSSFPVEWCFGRAILAYWGGRPDCFPYGADQGCGGGSAEVPAKRQASVDHPDLAQGYLARAG